MAEEDSGRLLKRRNLIYYLPVHDRDRDALLGHLVDITTDGLKLVSPAPIEEGRLFRLRLELPEHYFEQRELCFKARSRWTRPDVNPELSTTGFTLEEMDDQAKDVVSGLVSLYAFND